MPARRYRYVGETPVMIPDLAWGDPDHPVMPGEISEPYEGEVNNELLVPVVEEPPLAPKGGKG